MAALVNLQDLIDVVQSQSDTVWSFLDRSTGEIYAISEEVILMADDERAAWDKVPDWQREEVELARRISASEQYTGLPTSWDVNQWAIMHQFCYSLADQRLRGEFLTAIHGRGCFRRFKAQLTHHGLWEPWNTFQRHAISEVVIEWCHEHGVPLVV